MWAITYTPNIGNTKIDDIFDNNMPSNIIEFASGITQTQVGNLTCTNVFDASQCTALQEGLAPRPLSNLNGVFTVVDPLYYYVGHPQVHLPISHSILNSITDLLYSGNTSAIAVANATKTSINNSYGGINEACEITLTSSDGRAVATVAGANVGDKLWIDLDVKRSESIPVNDVSVEVWNATGNVLLLRRRILLKSTPEWQRVVLPFVPNETTNFNVRIHSSDYTSGVKTRFCIGNLNVYRNHTPINTGHNSGFRDSWSLQHTVKGSRHEWVDGNGNIRAKNSPPTNIDDGVIISANPIIT